MILSAVHLRRLTPLQTRHYPLSTPSRPWDSMVLGRFVICCDHVLIHAVDDDFADFQAAPVQTGGAAPAPAKPNLMDLLNATPSHRSSTPPTFGPSSNQQPSLFGSPRAGSVGTSATSAHRPSPSLSTMSPLAPQIQPTQTGNMFGGAPLANTTPIRSMSAAPTSKPASAQSKPSSSNFDDLWSMSLGGSKPAAPSTGSKSMKALEKEKAQATLWGSQATSKSPVSTGKTNDIFGSFGNAGLGSGGKSNGGNDDLLL